MSCHLVNSKSVHFGLPAGSDQVSSELALFWFIFTKLHQAEFIS